MNVLRAYICIIGLTCVLSISTTSFVQAQTLTIPTIEETIEATIRPKLPRAHDDVSISVVNYNTNFDEVTIRWYVNDVLISEGIGETSFNFTTGAAGTETKVTMEATTREGRVIERVYTFNPGEVDLIWEADSYAPPFYRGKKLHPVEGTIRIVAVPLLKDESGATLNANDVIYTWKVDNKPRRELSGYGKRAITLDKKDTFKANLPVSVEVSAPNSVMVASNTMTVQTVRPIVLLYEHNPLYGMWFNRTLTSGYDLLSEEIKITAQPLFFGVRDPDHAKLNYSWSMNGQRIDFTDSTRNTLTLRHTGGSGESRIQVEAQHDDALFQGGIGKGIIRFGRTRNALDF